MNVYVSQYIEYMNRKPTQCKGRHQECNQTKDLPLTSLLSTCLDLWPVTWCNTFPQFDSDTEVRHKDSWQWQDISDQQGAVRISTSFLLLTQPEFLTDGEAFIFELYIVGVSDSWSYQSTGQQPDASEDGGTCSHRGALLQGMNCGIISTIKKELYFITRWSTVLINAWFSC